MNTQGDPSANSHCSSSDKGSGEFTPLPYSIPTIESQSRIDRLIDETMTTAWQLASSLASEIRSDPDWRKKVIWRYPKKHS
jgi:hypothetical protein